MTGICMNMNAVETSVRSTRQFIDFIERHGLPQHLHLSYWLSHHKTEYDSLPHCIGHIYHHIQLNPGRYSRIPTISIDLNTDKRDTVIIIVEMFRLNLRRMLTNQAKERLDIIGVI